ncbi:MerR family transcriptional regulator [Deinococcus murrayi]|uniref:MerR family transcriptional regulator n=1 Tax=Deinococcus murrayi TaxID=68910 RepID=UPI00054EF033|nr:MerR family transcriptional regulator [Deinococcus murrayi]
MTDLPEPLLTISHFARLSRLSPKALRLYDALGLLRPAQVDPASGYRFYVAGQLEEARLIGLLRRLEMPLPQIQELLRAPGADRAELLAQYWQGLQRGMREKESLVAYLTGYFGQKETQMFEIQEREVPPLQVIGKRGRVHLGELPAFIARTFQELQRHLAAQDAPFAGAPYTLFYGEVSADSDGPVEVCIPFLGQVSPGQGMTVRREPAFREAYATLTGAQRGQVQAILTAHDEVAGWLKQHGKTLARPAREVYLQPQEGEEGERQAALEIAYPYWAER